MIPGWDAWRFSLLLVGGMIGGRLSDVYWRRRQVRLGRDPEARPWPIYGLLAAMLLVGWLFN